jgi:hypothetical protein
LVKAGVAVILVGLTAGAPCAQAATTAKDVQVILKSIGFLTSKPLGDVKIAVVFDPANTASKADADSIKSLLDAAKGGSVVPAASLLAISQLSSLDSLAAVVADGVSPAGLEALAGVAKAKKILTISTDPTCARTGKCVLSVRSDPKVEILFNGAVSSVEFLPNFRMMITEL